MKLDIIVPHYKEPWTVGKKLFDSIAIQECVDFSNIRVILVNDGGNCELDVPFYDIYPFTVLQYTIRHGGVSVARNAGLKAAAGDIVMFCDFDDCFSDIFALNKIFAAMHDNQHDVCVGCFTEETIDHDKNIVLVQHDMDFMFIHGKAYRRQFLAENNIAFCEKLTIHEDIYFSILIQMVCPPSRVTAIRQPIYCWRWNPDSVCRKGEKDYVLRTYDHLIRQRFALTEELLRRGLEQGAMVVIVKTIIDAYYDSQKKTFRNPENKKYLTRMERWFAAYYMRYGIVYHQTELPVIAGMMKSCRDLALKDQDFLVEHETLAQWTQHIRKNVDPIPDVEIDVLEELI